MDKITKVQDKSTQLIAILQGHFGKNMNLARIKLFGMFICALCKVQTVVSTSSPPLLKVVLKASRVYGEFSGLYWKFGETNINILTLAIVYQCVAFPILYTMMSKYGNSNTEE